MPVTDSQTSPSSPPSSSAQLKTSRPPRVPAVDVLRGLVMVLMVLDHTRDFFSNKVLSLTDPSQQSYAYFFTRWVTHLCAPTFVFLAGVSVYLQLSRGKTKGELSAFLVKRGLWLVLVEVLLVSTGFFFAFGPPMLQVIWAMGLAMILLAGMIWLPMPVILGISLLLIAGHNHFDSLQAASFGAAGPLWLILHQPGPLIYHGHFEALLMYPLVPWNGVMMLGYCFGQVVCLPTEQRIRRTALFGAASVALFLVLRLLHGYGEPNGWTAANGTHSLVQTFLNVTKYPPSLHYILLMGGIALLLLALFDTLLEQGRALWLRSTFEVYGRVPFAYYLGHIYLAHGLAVLVGLVMGWDMHYLASPITYRLSAQPPAGYGFGLPGVYALWLLVVGLLYWPMRKYAEYKRNHPEKRWLSYL